MKKSKIVVGFIILLYLGFVVFQFKSNEYWATALDALLLPLITIAYFQDQIKPNLYFSIFLICYSVSDLMVFIVDFIPYRMYYYIGNSIYILAYFALLTKILKSLSLSYIFKNFKLWDRSQ